MKQMFGVIVMIAAAILGYTAVSYLMRPSAASFDKGLMAAASELNKTLPMMVDNETRFDSAVAGPGRMFFYSYTLVNMSGADVDPADFAAKMTPKLVNNYRTLPQMKTFRNNKVTLNYIYHDKDGVVITNIEVRAGS